MADQFWENDRPANVEEALTLLRYGAVMSPLRSEQLVDQARTEKRMKACADFFEMALRACEAASALSAQPPPAQQGPTDEGEK